MKKSLPEVNEIGSKLARKILVLTRMVETTAVCTLSFLILNPSIDYLEVA